MLIDRRGLLGGALQSPQVPILRARAQTPTIKIGVLGDEFGMYRDLSGPVAVEAVKLAVADSKAAGRDIAVEILVGDHQNKADIGASLARQWIERDGVDMIADTPNSGVALAVAGVCKELDKAFVNSPAATVDLTGKQCAPTTVHWTMDTWMLAHSTGGAMVKAGGDSWFFITADYAFGHALERDTSNFVTQAGGKVLGNVDRAARHQRFLVVSDPGAGQRRQGDRAGQRRQRHRQRIKQAGEFGITTKGVKLAGLLVFISDVHALGLQTAQGIVVSNTFYWDRDDRTRAFSKRLQPTDRGRAAGHGAGRVLCRDVPLPEGGRGDGRCRGEKERCSHGGAHEGDADRRRLFRARVDPRGWPVPASGLPV